MTKPLNPEIKASRNAEKKNARMEVLTPIATLIKMRKPLLADKTVIKMAGNANTVWRKYVGDDRPFDVAVANDKAQEIVDLINTGEYGNIRCGMSAFVGITGNEVYVNKWRSMCDEYNARDRSVPTQEQKDNWLSLEEMEAIETEWLLLVKTTLLLVKRGETPTRQQWRNVMYYILWSLCDGRYNGGSPSRSMEWTLLKNIGAEYDADKDNYIRVNDKGLPIKIVISTYKGSGGVARPDGTGFTSPKDAIIISIPTSFGRLLKLWCEYNTSEWCFVSEDNTQTTPSMIAKYLHRITHKKVGVVMLRNIKATQQFAPILNLSGFFKRMGSSSKMTKHYVKDLTTSSMPLGVVEF